MCESDHLSADERLDEIATIVSAFGCVLSGVVYSLLERDILPAAQFEDQIKLILAAHEQEPLAREVLRPLLDLVQSRSTTGPTETLRS